MAISQDDARIVAHFKSIAVPNAGKSKEAGRPIFDDMEVVEIRFGGDRNKVSVFPAHEFSMHVPQEDGTTVPMTYAQRFADNYRRFKQNRTQIKEGTPLEELPFLTQAKRSELKALNIHTAETLAALDAEPLKTLGQDGRELKNRAVAYMQAASGTAEMSKLVDENEALRAQLAEAQAQAALFRNPLDHDGDGKPGGAFPGPTAPSLEIMSISELKDFIKAKSGARPQGNPSRDSLLGIARELEQSE